MMVKIMDILTAGVPAGAAGVKREGNVDECTVSTVYTLIIMFNSLNPLTANVTFM